MICETVEIYSLLLSRRELDRLAQGEWGDDPIDFAIRRKAEEKLRLIGEKPQRVFPVEAL